MQAKFEEVRHLLETYKERVSEKDVPQNFSSKATVQEDLPLLVQRALVFIIAHLFDPKLTVGWMKQQCRINGNNFSGKFKYHLGKTPKQYILFHRMEVAKQLLSKIDLADVPISAIAFELGFSSAAVFSNAFKSRMGESPSRWRKRDG